MRAVLLLVVKVNQVDGDLVELVDLMVALEQQMDQRVFMAVVLAVALMKLENQQVFLQQTYSQFQLLAEEMHHA